MIEVRALTPDDWPLWRRLRLAALAEAPYAFGSKLSDWQTGGDREERWRARLALPGQHLIAMRADQPVGMASGMPTAQPGTVELVSMWVSPPARGLGIGGELISAVQGWARQVGARTLRLAVMPGNAAAIALYRRSGFQQIADLGDPLPDGGGYELIMVKSVPRDEGGVTGPD